MVNAAEFMEQIVLFSHLTYSYELRLLSGYKGQESRKYIYPEMQLMSDVSKLQSKKKKKTRNGE